MGNASWRMGSPGRREKTNSSRLISHSSQVSDMRGVKQNGCLMVTPPPPCPYSPLISSVNFLSAPHPLTQNSQDKKKKKLLPNVPETYNPVQNEPFHYFCCCCCCCCYCCVCVHVCTCGGQRSMCLLQLLSTLRPEIFLLNPELTNLASLCG